MGGSIESTLIGIIAGFSVDYVVHLAHAYEIASGDTYARVTEAFSDLGISVFNGMITSVLAKIPLFFCSLQFFAKFGTFLCLTIAYSWIFAKDPSLLLQSAILCQVWHVPVPDYSVQLDLCQLWFHVPPCTVKNSPERYGLLPFVEKCLVWIFFVLF